MASSVELRPCDSTPYAPGPGEDDAPGSAAGASPPPPADWGATDSGLHDKKAARATVRDKEAALNEPDENLTLGGIFKRGWFLFTFQKGKQLLAGFAGALPLSLLFGLMVAFPQMVPEYANLWYIGLVVFDVAFIVYLPSIGGAITCLTGAAHVGDRISIGTAYRRTWAHYGQLILAFCGVYMGTIIGLYLLIVPGLWFLSRYGLAWVIVPLEKCSASEAFTRSAELQKGRGGVALAIHGLMGLVNAALIAAFIAITVVWNTHLDTSAAVNFFVLFGFMQLTLMSTVPYIPVLTAFYYDCIRRARLQSAGGV